MLVWQRDWARNATAGKGVEIAQVHRGSWRMAADYVGAMTAGSETK